MGRFFRFGAVVGSLLFLGSCMAPIEDWDPFPDEQRYQIVVESIEFSPTKPGGEPWDDFDGRPDPCVLVGDEWAWTDMTPIAWDEFTYDWHYVTYTDYSLEELQYIGLTINDEDPEGEDDGTPTPTPTPNPTPTADPTATPTATPQPTPTPPDNGLECDKIEGTEIGDEGITLQVGTKVVTIHDWVLKAGQTNEYHGFSWDQTGTVDVYVKAGNQTYIASGGSWMHPNASSPSASAISNVQVCNDSDDQLHYSIESLVPNDPEGQTFVFYPGPGKGVERLVISVRKSDWGSDW